MFHGNKKKEKTQLSEEEEKKIEEQLFKIKAIQNKILEMRNDLKENDLDFLLKSAVLMPDFPSLWNLRKMIILHYKDNKTEEEFYSFIKNEIKIISPIMLKNPKSYMLWYHR